MLNSPELDAYWASISSRYNLPEECTAGYTDEDEDESEDDLEVEDEGHEDAEGDDSSSDWSSSDDEDPRDHPLFFARIERMPKYCSVCHCKTLKFLFLTVANDSP